MSDFGIPMRLLISAGFRSGSADKISRTADFMVNIEMKDTHFCPSDLRIATKPIDSRESEFPRTDQACSIISNLYHKT